MHLLLRILLHRRLSPRHLHIVCTCGDYPNQLVVHILRARFPDLGRAYGVYLKLVEILNKRSTPAGARLNLARWYNDVDALKIPEFSRVLDTFDCHNDTIVNYFDRRLTNASAESFNAKIKAFRAQFRGVGDIKFFMFRLATLYA